MAETVVYHYVAANNPHGGYLPGVPLRDLTAADLAALPAWLRPSVAAQPFYEAVAVTAKAKRPEGAEVVDHG
jgi:hypothetical protein